MCWKGLGALDLTCQKASKLCIANYMSGYQLQNWPIYCLDAAYIRLPMGGFVSALNEPFLHRLKATCHTSRICLSTPVEKCKMRLFIDWFVQVYFFVVCCFTLFLNASQFSHTACVLKSLFQFLFSFCNDFCEARIWKKNVFQ